MTEVPGPASRSTLNQSTGPTAAKQWLGKEGNAGKYKINASVYAEVKATKMRFPAFVAGKAAVSPAQSLRRRDGPTHEGLPSNTANLLIMPPQFPPTASVAGGFRQ